MTTFFEPKPTDQLGRAGLGPDGVLRDAWNNPYIISFDMNYDNQTRDSVYRHRTVSYDTTAAKPIGGVFEAVKNDPASFESRQGVMIWSLGPDGAATSSDLNPPDLAKLANQVPNKDNI